jgi:hypothetical protein
MAPASNCRLLNTLCYLLDNAQAVLVLFGSVSWAAAPPRTAIFCPEADPPLPLAPAQAKSMNVEMPLSSASLISSTSSSSPSSVVSPLSTIISHTPSCNSFACSNFPKTPGGRGRAKFPSLVAQALFPYLLTSFTSSTSFALISPLAKLSGDPHDPARSRLPYPLHCLALLAACRFPSNHPRPAAQSPQA